MHRLVLVAVRLGGRQRTPDRHQQHGQYQVGQGVEDDRKHPADGVERSAQRRTDKRCRVRAALVGSHCRAHVLGRHDQPQRGDLRRHEERVPGAAPEGDDSQVSDGEVVEPARDGDRSVQDRADQATGDQDLLPAQPIHQGAGRECGEDATEGGRHPDEAGLDR